MKNKNRILILFAHPAFQKSRVNRRMIRQVSGLQDVHIHDLYEAYPEFDIDVSNEQELMDGSDLIVFQYPFFWFSTPAIIKEWLDLVLEHGWAYGSKGKALQGKTVMLAITTGGRESAYGNQGLNRYSMREFLRPLEQTARLCGMHFLPPFIVHGTHQMTDDTIEQHAADYLHTIKALRDGLIDLTAVCKNARINIDTNHDLKITGGKPYAK